MALADDIYALRDRVVADLMVAHDYYTDTKIAWDIVHKAVAAGNTFTIRNMTTGTVTTQADLAGKARGYVAEQLTEATFQQFVSLFEDFFFDLLRLWLMAYPQSLMGKKVDFKAVLDAPDKDAITLLVVNKELNELLYERPASWFAYLEDRAKLGCPTANEIDQIAEAKASRDVLVHNRGVANKIYESKAGRLARYKDGQRIDIPEHYHRDTWQLIRKVVTRKAGDWRGYCEQLVDAPWRTLYGETIDDSHLITIEPDKRSGHPGGIRMNRIIVKSRVGSDGILQLTLPVGPDDVDQEVQITVEPVRPASLSSEEWRRRTLETAGKWQGEFERPEQGEYEQREPLS